VAKACAAHGIGRLVQMSAIGADANSDSKYARTKAMGEAAARAAVPTAVVIRPSVVFGPDDALFNRFAVMAGLSPVLPLPGGGCNRFQPVFVGDVAKAIATCVVDPSTQGKTYELGGPEVVTYRQLMELMMRETGRNRLLLPLPWPLARLIGVAGDIQARLTPIPPLLTSDQVTLLQSDNIVSADALGLADLGVEPTAMEAIIATYLYRYRPGGQFAEAPAAVLQA
jgi:NADH dehydrogenase